MIRKANADNIKNCIDLFNMSGKGELEAILPGVEDKVIREILEAYVKRPENMFSKNYIWIEENEDNKPRAMISLISGKDLAKAEFGVAKHSGIILNKVGFFKLMNAYMSGLKFYKNYPNRNADELYLNAVAVYPEYRNQGIFTKLVKYSFEYCKELGLKAVYTFVKASNNKVIMRYEKLGFKISDSFNYPTRKGNIEHHKMYKPIE
ncbi:MAG: GNAT family N-acetyltransferase [Spirochaetota bacterium]